MSVQAPFRNDFPPRQCCAVNSRPPDVYVLRVTEIGEIARLFARTVWATARPTVRVPDVALNQQS
ncbi:hypothetical protein RRF57_009724 [Xylaria bambusicola]|uniref:Uncharacterized protein n=1 Tax=Xylaria bambusicola TaxID=326684 RepID=A0AAN7Z215_9PEZI